MAGESPRFMLGPTQVFSRHAAIRVGVLAALIAAGTLWGWCSMLRMPLETIGFYSEARGSQKYPPPLSLFYPSTGDFVGFVGDRASSDLVRRAIGTFRRTTPFPKQGAALFAGVPGVGWSDQWSFWQVGHPGEMITDTAPFRYPHYHTQMDTPDKLDYPRMARVVLGLGQVVGERAGVAR